MIMKVSICSTESLCWTFLPFLLFSSGKPTPKYVQYFGKVLSGAVFGLLVVYCLKNVSVFEGSRGIPEMIGILLYMLLVQMVF